MKIRAKTWSEPASKIIEAGYAYIGLCGCAANARKYRSKSFPAITIRIFPQLEKVKLYLNNKSQTPHEPYHKIDEVLALARQTEMAAREQRENN